jgi:hypothetical protein
MARGRGWLGIRLPERDGDALVIRMWLETVPARRRSEAIRRVLAAALRHTGWYRSSAHPDRPAPASPRRTSRRPAPAPDARVRRPLAPSPGPPRPAPAAWSVDDSFLHQLTAQGLLTVHTNHPS